MLKTLLNNRYFQLAVMFIAGGAAAALLLPERIVTKERIVTQLAERVVVARQHTVTQRVTKGDTITETIVSDTDTGTNETIHSDLKETEVTHTNPKRFLVYAGLGSSLQHFTPIVQGGIMATLWGPITLGGYADSEGTLGATVGFRW